jgi:hypothetical protein
MDSNTVTFTGSMIYAISYIEDSFVPVGQGEPPPTISQSGFEWTLTIPANHNNSSSAAASFNAQSGGPAHEYSEGTWSDDSPAELHFFFGVTVTVLLYPGQQDITLYFGQGHTGLRNNWWIGGSNVAWVNAPFFYDGPVISIGSTQYYLSGGVSSFNLDAKPSAVGSSKPA